MKVYQVISAVQADLAAIGISKDSENKFDKYKFRGIDAVYNALAPLIAKHKLCILPRILTRTCEERQSEANKALFYVTVDAEFDFVAAEDGSKHTVRMFGEAMDRGDKATNKAVSAAYKYACFQAFCIPTEETASDADSESHDVKAKAKSAPKAKQSGPEPDAEIVAQFNAAPDIPALTTVMNGLPNDIKRLYTGHFNERMSALKLQKAH